MSKEFLRRGHYRYSRLGRKRKKVQKWRCPKGRHNKMRRSREGYCASPTVGFMSPRKSRTVKPLLVHNLKEIQTLKKGDCMIMAKIGAKKRIELVRKAIEMGVIILNLREEKE